ncbi:hypothetical protein ZIOFF_049054 [Zingiber officinale]|uniref:THH1/TOM1/TOM3 domain-containing protein n=1 Tax=Zingiber officinale TaxID=94328 RepID=A0A8J5FS33_ZINOF|nr:hypothetical protein ZIOFF_049054 [Zingiber officinale]
MPSIQTAVGLWVERIHFFFRRKHFRTLCLGPENIPLLPPEDSTWPSMATVPSTNLLAATLLHPPCVVAPVSSWLGLHHSTAIAVSDSWLRFVVWVGDIVEGASGRDSYWLVSATGSSMRREGEAAMRCLPKEVAAADAVLAAVDGAVAVVAFLQVGIVPPLKLAICFFVARDLIEELFRIHLRNQQLGWTRQKIFHLMIGSSNIGYVAYFISALVATCKGWQCWSHGCGFVLMVGPQIIFFAAFLLLISFWVDLCHQASDDEEEDYERGYSEALLDKSMDKQGRPHVDGCRVFCFPRAIQVGSRQKFVILVIALTFISMIVFSILIWIGGGKNSIDSSIAARVYLYTFSAAMLLLGGALASYGDYPFSIVELVVLNVVEVRILMVVSVAVRRGDVEDLFESDQGRWSEGGYARKKADSPLVAVETREVQQQQQQHDGDESLHVQWWTLLFSKMSKVRSEMASTEMWKVASLAAVSVLSFTSSAVLALSTTVPLEMLSHWPSQHSENLISSIFIFLYYFIGSSVPSGFVLLVMRDMPPPHVAYAHRPSQSTVVTFIRERDSASQNPQWRNTVTSSQNKPLRFVIAVS